MNRTVNTTYRRDARVLRALASETRLLIVNRLAQGECCVCELVELVGCDQSTVSKHLATLRDSGIVEGERRGNHVYYRLLSPGVMSVLSCVAKMSGRLDGQPGESDEPQD
ncbi:MAG: metalloregulator ArsR/SmtB family transcription factor [Candidatus Eisenbacteria bacterium]|nr:metalloregulator ArsR/SmtB family transcription factor [Candidatus Eisenbacteria bacterium]